MTNDVLEGRPRVLITGATGLLGRQTFVALKETGCWEVRGLSYTRGQPPMMVNCDLTLDGEARRQVLNFQPAVVLHLAAERRPDVVQKSPERARKLNVDVVRDLGEACQECGAWMVYISTDYVFDGTRPPYGTDMKPQPVNGYGKQKAEAEVAVLRDPNATVLRIPLLYGQVEFVDESSVTALYGNLLKGMKKADHQQRRYPTYANDVAMVLKSMLDLHLSGRSLAGIFHWQSNQCLTKYDMVKVIGDVTGIDTSEILPDLDPPVGVMRPEDSCLDCSKLELELGDDCCSRFRTPFREGIKVGLRKFSGAIKSEEVMDVFRKATDKDKQFLARDVLIGTLRVLMPDLEVAAIEELLVAAGVGVHNGDIEYETFVKWVFQ